MVFPLFSPRKKVANIVFSDHCIRFLELKPNDRTITDWGEHALPHGVITEGKITDEKALLTILEECVNIWGLKKRAVRFVVPDAYVVLRKEQVPSSIKAEELKDYLFLEIGSRIHLPFEDPLYDAVMLDKGENSQGVLLVASKEEVVLSYQEVLQRAGLKPLQADISPLALYRVYYHQNLINEEEHTMLLHVDDEQVTVSIFHRNIPVFMRPIALEEEEIIIQQLEGTDETQPAYNQLDSVFREIEKVTSFYRYTIQKGDSQVTRIFLSGDHPMLVEIKHRLTEQLGINVDLISHESYLDGNGEPVPHSFSLPLGLSLKGVT